MTRRPIALMLPAALLLSSCAGSSTPAPTPAGNAVAQVSTGGTRTATLTLPKAIEAHVWTVRCTGKGTLTFTGDIAETDSFAGDLNCPGEISGDPVQAPAGSSVNLSIETEDEQVTGVLELVPAGS